VNNQTNKLLYCVGKFWRKYWSASYMNSIFKNLMKSLFEILRSPIKSIFRRPCWACVVFVQSWKDGKSKQMHHLHKVIYTKYSKHWPYTVAHTIKFCLQKMLNHGFNHGLFISLFKLITRPMHWIVSMLSIQISYLNFKAVLALSKMPALPRHIKVWVSFELFGALYMYISAFTKKYRERRRTAQVSLLD
jgi:hypothetical protein